jgi:hypothetical protein
MPALPVIKKGAFIEFMRGDDKLKGEVYKISQNESGRFRYHVFVKEYKGDQWTAEDNQIIGIITEEEYKTGFTPYANFSEDRTRMMNEPSLDGRSKRNGRSRKGVKKSKDKKKKSPSRYNLFVKKNFHTCGGDFKKIAEMWKKHKNDEKH